jgi:hypothetical protein
MERGAWQRKSQPQQTWMAPAISHRNKGMDMSLAEIRDLFEQADVENDPIRKVALLSNTLDEADDYLTEQPCKQDE